MRLVFFALGKNDICEDAKKQSTGDGGQGDLAERNRQSADAGDQNDSHNKQILACTQIDLLDHLQAGNCDEAIKGDADTAHDAVGDRSQESHKGSEEGNNDAQHSSRCDGHNGSVPGDSNTADRFAVSGVGAAAEECACDRTDTVTQQGAMQAGLFQQITSDDAGQVLVVSNVLCKDHKRHRDICDCDGCDEGAVDVLDALESFQEGEVGDREDFHILEDGEVDDLQLHIVGGNTDGSENSSSNVTNQDAQNEGDQLHHLFAVNGEQDDCKQRDKTANQGDIGAAGGDLLNGIDDLAVFNDLLSDVLHDFTGGKIADSIAGKRQADNGNGGSDNDGGHQLADPFNACNLNNSSNDHVYQTCKYSAYDQTGVTGRSRSGTCKGGAHGSKECEGRAEENGAAELSKQLIDKRANTCTEQGGGLAHAVADDAGDCDGRCQDRQNLLECKQQHLAELWFVFDTVDQIHVIPSVL